MQNFAEHLIHNIRKRVGDDVRVKLLRNESVRMSLELNPGSAANGVIETIARPVPPKLPEYIYSTPSQSQNHNRVASINEVQNTFARTWNDEWTKSFKKTHEVKQTHKSFSPEFERIIGKESSRNITGLEDYGTAITLWDMLMEFAATNAWIIKSHDCIQDFWTILGNNYTLSMQNGTIPEWSQGGTKGYGFVELLCHAFTLDRWDARATLAFALNMDFTNLFTFSSSAYPYVESNAESSRSIIPTMMAFPQPGSKIMRLLDRGDIWGHSNQLIGALAHYKLGNNDFCVAITEGHGDLGIGKYKPKAQFLNQHLIDKNSGAAIILFQDARVAMAVQKRLDELRGYNANEFVVSAHLGSKLNILPWRYFSCHPIIFVPAPTPDSFVRFFDYRTYAKSFEVSYCKLASRLFLRKHPDSAALRHYSLQNEEETKLLREAVVVEECDDIIATIRGMIASAKNSESAKKWLGVLGLMKNGSEAQKQAYNSSPKKLPEPDTNFLPKAPHSLTDVSLYNTFKPGNYVLIVGPKDSGKTQIAFGVARQLLFGNQTWPFGPVASPINENVCYVDGETLQDEYEPNLQQHGLAHLLKRRLFFLSKYDRTLPDFCENFSLRNENFRLGLKDFLLTHVCRYVILDNLVSLTGNSPDGCSSDVLSWIENIQQEGICVCLLHHAHLQDDARARSNENYVNKARVRIDLIHKEKLTDIDGFQNNFLSLAKQPMLTVGISYKYHKAAPILVGNTFIVSLPFENNKWIFHAAVDVEGKPLDLPWREDSAIQKLDGGRTSDSAIEVSQVAAQLCQGSAAECGQEKATLSPDERKLLDILQQMKGTATRSEFEDKCGWCSQKVLAILKALIAKGRIKKDGAGKSSYYILVS